MNTKKPDVIIVGHLGTSSMSATDMLVERLKKINCGALVVTPEKERGITINEIVQEQQTTKITIQQHEPLPHLGIYKDGQANRRERREQKRKNKK